ncbi:hypothetical protein Tco_1439411 [Tanacetum coccineum]
MVDWVWLTTALTFFDFSLALLCISGFLLCSGLTVFFESAMSNLITDSPLELIAYSDSDYADASLDRKSTTGGCQFLGCRLVSWQCKKQTIVANSITEAEYIAASNYNNVADLLTKAFNVTRFKYLITSIELKMANLKYCDKHNMVAFLKKPTESEGFTKIVDFLKGSSLRYALTHNPTIYDSLVKQFWQTATVRTLANGIQQIIASIDNKEYIVTEASVRSTLQLANATSINNLPDAEIYEGLTTLGYVTEGKLTFWKKNFSPQWKFLIHHLLYCISPKSGGWDQFGSPIATALICLSRNRAYNFSKLIFDGMVHNIESTSKFLMYPRFFQIILDITTANNGKYLAKTLTKKLFANMKRGYAGDHVPLLPAILAGATLDQEPQPSSPPRSPNRKDTEIPQSQGPTITTEPDEATTTRVEVDTEGATTTTSGLDEGLDSGNIHESPLRSNDTPLHDVPTSESVEDSIKLQELSLLVPKLEKKIDSLENELKETKQTLGSAILTLVKKVKSLEVALKRKSKKVVVSDSEEEETKA